MTTGIGWRIVQGAAAVTAAGLVIALVALTPARASGPPIKTQQCNVDPLPSASFDPRGQLYVGNRSNVITRYTGLSASGGYVTNPPDAAIGGSGTLLSLVSKNYLAGMAQDAAGRLYVSGANVNTVTVYADPALDSGTNGASLLKGTLSGNGLSQPAGLAYDNDHNLLYVANAGNNTITAYAVTTAVGGSVSFQLKKTQSGSGLSAPLGLALVKRAASPTDFLYVANRGSNSIGVFSVDASGGTPALTPIANVALPDLTGPIGIAMHPEGTRLYVANNGKVASAYSVTIYPVNPATGVPSGPAAHIGGDKTGLCNPSTVALGGDVSLSGSTSWGLQLVVANRESSGGSITIYNLNRDGSLKVTAGEPTDFNVRPAAMMLHNTTNQLGAPVGLVYKVIP